jgi:hypothetical protein
VTSSVQRGEVCNIEELGRVKLFGLLATRSVRRDAVCNCCTFGLGGELA